jgi:hypothetical protein
MQLGSATSSFQLHCLLCLSQLRLAVHQRRYNFLKNSSLDSGKQIVTTAGTSLSNYISYGNNSAVTYASVITVIIISV